MPAPSAGLSITAQGWLPMPSMPKCAARAHGEFETFALCHIHACEAFGGVARDLAYDSLATPSPNMMAVWFSSSRASSGFARKYGFYPQAYNLATRMGERQVQRARSLSAAGSATVADHPVWLPRWCRVAGVQKPPAPLSWQQLPRAAPLHRTTPDDQSRRDLRDDLRPGARGRHILRLLAREQPC